MLHKVWVIMQRVPRQVGAEMIRFGQAFALIASS